LHFLYRTELEIDGYEIREAASGQAALRILSSEKVDGVVMDLVMPDMNGLQMIEEILVLRRNIPIIINTGYPLFREDFHCWGADAFVTKSSDLTALKNAVTRHLGVAKSFVHELENGKMYEENKLSNVQPKRK
jgi:CheY-like chemotaxis protein